MTDHCLVAIAVVLLTLVYHGNTQGSLPQMSPFFFLCNYHGNSQELGVDSGEVRLSVSIMGNPDTYIPGKFYPVTVTSSLNFDAFLLTGLYTISQSALTQMAAIRMQAMQPIGQNLMCSIVHSHMSAQPLHEFQFTWMAPPAGTGCVSFLATATLQQQMLFKDTIVLQLCEEGAPTLAPLRPDMTALHSDGFIFRDDFYSDDSFSNDHWSSHEGATISDECGTIFTGKGLVMCKKTGNRELITQPLNTTTAIELQFFLGTGTCGGNATTDQDIVVLFGLNGCTDWHEIQRFRPPVRSNQIPQIYLVYLPPKARGEGICFAWKQAPTILRSLIIPDLVTVTDAPTKTTTTTVPTTTTTGTTTTTSTTTTTTTEQITTFAEQTTEDEFIRIEYDIAPVAIQDQPYDYPVGASADAAAKFSKKSSGGAKTKKFFKSSGKVTSEDTGVGDEPQGTYQGCWVLDNIFVVNMAHVPSQLQADFDPVDPSDWVAIPGAHLKHKCHAENTAAVFDQSDSSVNGLGSNSLNMAAVDLEADTMLHEEFESKNHPGWVIDGGHEDVICGIIHEANSLVFNGAGKSRKICTPFIDTRKAGNVRFHFGMGSGSCRVSGEDKAEVMVYVEDENDHTLYILEKLSIKAFKEPRLVSIPLDPKDKHPKARICWLQKYNGGEDEDVWAIDNIMVLPYLPERSEVNKDKVAQFSLNLQCGNYPENNNVAVEYSTNHGVTWHRLHKPCLPGQCRGNYYPENSIYSSADFDSWTRVTSLLPYAAMVPNLRIRFVQIENSPNWALDNVYVGICPEGCNSHGSCKDGVCHCDFGYTGLSCKHTVVPNPTILLENFDGPGLLTSSVIANIQGAQLSYACDVLSSSKAVVFNGGGHRQLVTGQINTTNNQYFQFNIRVGSNSPVSECPPPESSQELVVLDYSCNGGITWHLLKTFDIYQYRQPKSDSVMLPEGARDIGCQFRWWQPEHSGPGRAVWALDDLSLNSHLFNTLHLHMGNWVDIGEKLTVTHGKLTDSYCRRMKSLSFIGRYKEEDIRFLTTESMHIGPGYIMQFDLVMGCGLPYTQGIDNRLYLEYSSDHGIHWSLVQDPCIPPVPCPNVQQGTVYDWTQYSDWTRVTVPLPPTTWGPGTRFRLQQSNWGPTDMWAVARLYIGQQCPDMCNGHGECNEGTCVCDEGFSGDTCQPVSPLAHSMQADFGIRYEPKTDFEHIRGGKVVSNNRGCGDIFAGESLYFYDNGVRELVTKDMNTEEADMLQFYLRIGGGDRDCEGGDGRSEGVMLQYSTDGGITWTLMEELLATHYRTPKRIVKILPEDSKTPNTRFRWWQPSHSGKGTDQWAVDEIQLTQFMRLTSLEDDFDESVEPLDSGLWQTAADGVIGKYCMSWNPTLVMANSESDKMIVTKDMQLQIGDIIQFKVNVGCSNQFRWDHPVLFQYIHPQISEYKLVQEPCYQEMECNGHHTEGSIYYAGTHGHWELVVLPVTEELAAHPVSFRWWQQGGFPFNFALNDVYIGPPCEYNCHRYGVCKKGGCACDDNADDPACQSDDPTPYGMVDRFEQLHRPSDFWRRIWGGHLGLGCGTVDRGNALFFDGEGTREAVTVPLNTAHLRMLEFVLKIGTQDTDLQCQQPHSRNEGINVQYSTDNEITWHRLKMVEPVLYSGSTERVVLELPPGAKSNNTIFKWWQPLGYGGMPRAEWGLDSVTIGVNETNLDGFQDDFAGMMPDMFTWFQTESAVPRITCHSKGNALEFSRKSGNRYAETWDYHVTPSTFLQFDIAMGCDSLYGTLYGVMLEYSNDMGKNWQSVVSECTPPNFECSGYHLSSDYMSDQHRNWTRITVSLPPGAVSPATRFRWKQHSYTSSGSVWALDNVYLGDGCPWLCSGHGYCNQGVCVCDEGYEGEYCVPSKPLPMMLRDDFNREEPLNNNWNEIYGGHLNTMCGRLASGNALTFSEDHLRMAVSKDIDTTMLQTIEFYFLYGCNGEEYEWPRKESVLLQYSNNGGITWNLLKELHYRNESGPRFFSLDLPQKSRHNSTRFRFWQAANGGKMRSTWAIDNLFIGRMAINPSMMEDDFDAGVQSDSWLFVNDGVTEPYCESNTREDTVDAGHSALVFKQGLESGEHSVVTRDLDVGPMSVLQFDINVGCASGPTHKYPVRLEYSANGGKTWQLVVPNCAEVSSALCYDSILPTSIYYGGASKYWRRIVIPLDNLYVCGSLRFRWYQGFIPDDDFGPEWAVDNIFVGMACMKHCLGQGECSDTMMCSCDQGYQGDFCEPSESHPSYMKEGFVLVDEILTSPDSLPAQDTFSSPNKQLDEEKWDMWSGAVISRKCGPLVSGPSLYFAETGERALVTKEMDLSRATTTQFYLRLGCKSTTDPATPPVYLQYTTNGGINWNTIEQFDFNSNSNEPFYVVLNLPVKSRSPATQLRWWQPSKDGTFMENWAIDQIYIGGNADGEPLLADQPLPPKDPNWILYPGGTVESVCDSDFDAIHFTGEEKYRFAVSADVVVEDGTFLQFDLSMGCTQPKTCFTIDVEYSLDMGTTWKPLFDACYPSNIDCNKYYYPNSTFRSDMMYGWNTVNIPLPFYAKSKATRFRWRQAEGFNVKDTWAISNLYIGNGCQGWCHGNGKCSKDGSCICKKGWTGSFCDESVEKLPTYLYDMFTDGPDMTQWDRVSGAKAEKVCQVLSSGAALHFTGNCTRSITSKPLDLSSASLVQFYFMYGCHNTPDNIDESVLIGYSSDGVTWVNFGLLHYRNYRNPTFLSIQLPEGARQNNVRVGLWQMKHDGHNQDDWVIDNIRFGGNQQNPENLISDFSSGYQPDIWYTMDNMEHGRYCDSSDVAIGNTLEDESSTLTTQDIAVKGGHMLQFLYNIGCMRPWNVSVAPIHLQYSVDNGVTWSYLTKQCLPNEPAVCPHGESMASVYYGDPMGRWQRVTIPLNGMTVSSGTRFRWQQKAVTHGEFISSWALKDVYIGPQCDNMCGGHGYCHYPSCTCDEGYFGSQCYPRTIINPTELKDVFNDPAIDKSKWLLVQGGTVQDPCYNIVEGTAMVMDGSGRRQLVTVDLDLRDARFVQYYATIGGNGEKPGCYSPFSRDQGVILQYSTDGGISWHTLHTLDHASYNQVRRDYLILPQDARTPSTRVRWWSPLPSDPRQIQPTWSIDNVYIGGKEINPAEFHINFNESLVLSDQPWEFNPYGRIETEFCQKDDSVILWEEGSGERHFTSKQMIVQAGYILQFKVAVGCSQSFNACVSYSPVTLEYNKNPVLDDWKEVLPLCLPDINQRMDCRPNMYHTASVFMPDTYPRWTRVTISLPEKTFSSTTRFRWIQSSPEEAAPGWALDDIYVGESCPDMCHGRGDCKGGRCHCDPGYQGESCMPAVKQLNRMFDSFEGGIFTSHWDWVSGGDIGFGCGALLPYAHGKTLYFNGCGLRQARTVEMDLRRASKIMFVLQIGCQAQTPECNVKTDDTSQYRGILLQYSTNHGADWHLIARHDPADHLNPKRLAYDIPKDARKSGVQFRWWQPVHDGDGHDQWALDHVEVVPGRNNHMMYRRRTVRHIASAA